MPEPPELCLSMREHTRLYDPPCKQGETCRTCSDPCSLMELYEERQRTIKLDLFRI